MLNSVVKMHRLCVQLMSICINLKLHFDATIKIHVCNTMLWRYISRISGKNEEFEIEGFTKGISFNKWLSKRTSFLVVDKKLQLGMS